MVTLGMTVQSYSSRLYLPNRTL